MFQPGTVWLRHIDGAHFEPIELPRHSRSRFYTELPRGQGQGLPVYS
jgi:hypothetical protein